MTEQIPPEQGSDGTNEATTPSPAPISNTDSTASSGSGSPTGGVPDAVTAAVRAVEEAEDAAKKVFDAVSEATAPEVPEVPEIPEVPEVPEVPDLTQAPAGIRAESIGLLEDVQLQVRIELGRTRMLVEDVLRLSSGAVVELDKAAGDPVDIYVNGRRIARGEVLVLNENFCVRVSEIVDPQARTA